MEHTPNPDSINNQESISFNEQLRLAREMLAYANERNTFAQNIGTGKQSVGKGDFEGFATRGQYIGDNRAKYDELHAEYETYRKAFDEAVPDKKAFVRKLRSMNENELADAVASMFNVREGLLGNLFRK